ncbi:MAG: galactokinase [Dermatophilaceae bacterium]
MSRAGAIHREMFGAEPAGVWSAPGRVNLIGEHTDYNGGLVLPIALPQRTSAAASARDDHVMRVHSAQAGETVSVDLSEVGPGRPDGWAAYVAGVLWALRENGLDVRGLDVTIDGAVPLGAGLSSSAALECAVGAAASDLFGLGLLDDDAGRARLAAACVRAENEVAGAPTGGMDQAASLRCREDHALFLDCRSGAVEHAPFNLAAHGVVLLVTDTRAAHTLGDGQYGSRRAACERAAALLAVASLREVGVDGLDTALGRLDDLGDEELVRRTRHVVTEIARVTDAVAALRAGDLVGLGRLFDASHASLRDDFEVSCAELDVSVDVARAAGALGARMTGGGFGGSSIALVPEASVEEVSAVIRDAFAEHGFGEPASFAVTAGPPARREI